MLASGVKPAFISMKKELFDKKKYTSIPNIDYSKQNINYTVDEQNRQIRISGQVYDIPDFFNLPNLIKGEPKTVDYVLSYFLDGTYLKV